MNFFFFFGATILPADTLRGLLPSSLKTSLPLPSMELDGGSLLLLLMALLGFSSKCEGWKKGFHGNSPFQKQLKRCFPVKRRRLYGDWVGQISPCSSQLLHLSTD
ncbi:uncharacterized protein DS421_6g192400 [Arachis hypogaea]|nr:uncharacterized protein DS421_6g192400 [Arachis hypogaea]